MSSKIDKSPQEGTVGLNTVLEYSIDLDLLKCAI